MADFPKETEQILPPFIRLIISVRLVNARAQGVNPGKYSRLARAKKSPGEADFPGASAAQVQAIPVP
jgi:hypothetical protein